MTLHQGKKSNVSLIDRDGMDCVLKRYNDIGDPNVKCHREVAFYEWHHACDSLPDLIEVDCPNSILMSRLAGEPIASWHKSASTDDLRRISYEHGGLLSDLLRHKPAQRQASNAINRLSSSGISTWEKFAAIVLQNVEDYFCMNAAFDRPELRQRVDMAASVISLDGFWGETVVCKLDWNPGNIIVDGNNISGYVDFEQSFRGNRLAFLGTVIDHISVFDWTSTRLGLIDGLGDMPAAYELEAAATFSMCYKIHGCCHDGKIGFFEPNRLLEKFQTMPSMIYRAEQDSL